MTGCTHISAGCRGPRTWPRQCATRSATGRAWSPSSMTAASRWTHGLGGVGITQVGARRRTRCHGAALQAIDLDQRPASSDNWFTRFDEVADELNGLLIGAMRPHWRHPRATRAHRTVRAIRLLGHDRRPASRPSRGGLPRHGQAPQDRYITLNIKTRTPCGRRVAAWIVAPRICRATTLLLQRFLSHQLMERRNVQHDSKSHHW